jgi:SAM-dependent methyltransferase
VFEEIFRVLKPGGRIAVSDVVATQPLPDEMKNDPFLISACVGGAALIDDLEQWMQAAGFAQILIEPKDDSKEFIRDWAPNLAIEDYVVSAAIQAIKP